MTCFAAPVLLPTTTINTLIVTMMTGMRQEQRKRTLTESFERGIVEEVDLSVAPQRWWTRSGACFVAGKNMVKID